MQNFKFCKVISWILIFPSEFADFCQLAEESHVCYILFMTTHLIFWVNELHVTHAGLDSIGQLLIVYTFELHPRVQVVNESVESTAVGVGQLWQGVGAEAVHNQFVLDIDVDFPWNSPNWLIQWKISFLK